MLRRGKSPTTEWPHERGSAMHLEGSTDMPRIELVSVDTASAWPIDDFRLTLTRTFGLDMTRRC